MISKSSCKQSICRKNNQDQCNEAVILFTWKPSTHIEPQWGIWTITGVVKALAVPVCRQTNPRLSYTRRCSANLFNSLGCWRKWSKECSRRRGSGIAQKNPSSHLISGRESNSHSSASSFGIQSNNARNSKPMVFFHSGGFWVHQQARICR